MPSVQARGRAESEPLPPPDLDSDDEPDWEALAGRGRAAGEAPVPAAVPAKPESLSETVAARYGILRQASGRGADPAPPLSQSSSSAGTPVVHRNPAAAAALKGLRKQGTLNAADVHKANEIERATQKKKQERKLAFEVAERNYNDAYAKASPKQQEQARTYLLSANYQRSDKNTELGKANIARKDRGELSAPAQAIVSTAEMLNIARAAMERERPRHTPGIAMRHNLNGTLD